MSTLEIFKFDSDEFFFLKDPECANPPAFVALADVGVGGAEGVTVDDRGDETERARRLRPRPAASDLVAVGESSFDTIPELTVSPTDGACKEGIRSENSGNATQCTTGIQWKINNFMRVIC